MLWLVTTRCSEGATQIFRASYGLLYFDSAEFSPYRVRRIISVLSEGSGDSGSELDVPAN
jgi:hypothetical protein